MSTPVERENEVAKSRWRALAGGRRRIIGLLAPFVLLPLVARLAVGPIGDALAAAIRHAAPAAPASSHVDVDDAAEDVPLLSERRGEVTLKEAPRRVGSAASARPPSPDAGAAPKAGTIVVPASAIAKALEDKKVRARDAFDREKKPFGARLRGVSPYNVGLLDGDIVIEVGGVRVHSTSEMTEQGLKQAGGSTKLTGKIVRGDATYDVVLELPKES